MEEKSKSLLIGDSYESKADGTLVYKEPIKSKDTGEVVGIEETPIANHTPILQEQRVVDNGIEPVEELVFNVRRAGRMWGTVSVTLKEILSQTPNIKFGAACRIFVGRGAKARYSEAMQIQCENAPCSTTYQHTGFREIDGERVFLNGDYSVTADGLTDKYTVEMPDTLSVYRFTNTKSDERYHTLLSLLPSVLPERVSFAGLAVMFLTALNALLREVKIEPRFVLMLVGRTNSFKTSVASIFVSGYGECHMGKIPVSVTRDTPNAMERKFAVTDSTLVLADDVIPGVDLKTKAAMSEKVQTICRNIGDRVGRGRLNADSSFKQTYIPKCNVILTAEESYSQVGESAMARTLSVEMKPGEIDPLQLQELQAKTGHINECMSEFIQYVIQNWDELKKQLPSLFSELRTSAQSCGLPRLAETIAHLQLGIICMTKWLLSIGTITEEQSEALKTRSWSVLKDLAHAQNLRVTEEKPVKLFLDAIREMRDRGTIRIVDMDKPGEYSIPSVVGYRDRAFYYFYPDAIYSEVRRFYMEQDKNFPLGKTTLFRQLATDGLIETDKGQNTKVKRIKDGKRPRLLWLNATALDDEREENDCQ